MAKTKKFAQSYIDFDMETASSLNIQKTVNSKGNEWRFLPNCK